MRICFITPYHMNPKAPRIEKEMNILKEEKFVSKVSIIHPKKEQSIFARNMYLQKELKRQIDLYDKFIIYDLLTLFFLLPIIYNKKEKVIYEILDSFPYYYSYKLFKNKLLYNLSVLVIKKLESFLINKFTNNVIVNSQILYKRISTYSKDAVFIPYTSPFENKDFYNNPLNKICFLYIGLFTEDKGAMQILELSKKNIDIIFFIIGDINYSFNLDEYPNIITKGRINSNDLLIELKEISKKYFIYGISLIRSKNYSYAIQEANKDIDYLSLGIPIIGNKRKATYEKILNGAGILLEDFKIDEIAEMKNKQLSNRALEIYKQFYSNSLFKQELIDVVKKK